MNEFRELFEADIHRYGGRKYCGNYLKIFHWLFRKCQTERKAMLLVYRTLFAYHKKKNGIDLYYGTKIGKGLYLSHPYNITINADTIIGNNVNLSKGVTLGAENRGSRKGTPEIGDNVWIGVGAVIVGKVTIGNDVMICPNSFVNFDVPSHSIVMGNPGKIVKQMKCATEGYIDNRI